MTKTHRVSPVRRVSYYYELTLLLSFDSGSQVKSEGKVKLGLGKGAVSIFPRLCPGDAPIKPGLMEQVPQPVPKCPKGIIITAALPKVMKAATLASPQNISRRPLRVVEVGDPKPKHGEVLLRVRACGVCRTDLHIVEGELPAQQA